MLRKYFINRVFSDRSRKLMDFDWLRFKTRLSYRNKQIIPTSDRLHLGCGYRKVTGWYNVDIIDSDFNVDIASGHLPWPNNFFNSVVSQHVIEHLELESELIPLLRELRRTCKSGAEIYLSCPDMSKICQSYVFDRGQHLIEGRIRRFKGYTFGNMPVQHIINDMFHQMGEHKNLFDFELLQWTLLQAGIKEVAQISEKDLLRRFPEFPVRDDDEVTLYIKAITE